MKVLLGLFCLMLICVSNGKVAAEQAGDCVIKTGITIVAQPVTIDKDQRDCDYHAGIITTFQLTGPLDTNIIKLHSAAESLANLLGLKQDEVVHQYSKTIIFESHTAVIMKSYLYVKFSCLQEKFYSNVDKIFNSLVEGGDCRVEKDPTVKWFLLPNKNPPEKEPPETETKVKKYDVDV